MGKVDYVSIGSPLTNKYYLGRNDSYGLEHTPKRYVKPTHHQPTPTHITTHIKPTHRSRYGGALDNLRPQTNIDGLYVTGHDVGSVGIVGALNSGIMTAMSILSYTFWDLVVAKRNVIEDLMAMDKDREEARKKAA